MRRWTEADLATVSRRLTAAIGAPLDPKHVVRQKYGNRRVEFNGLKFDSKTELADHQAFLRQQVTGAIRGVARQVSIPLPGTNRRIRIDHMIVENDGRIRFYDSKGFDNAMGQLKRQQVLDGYGIKVELI